MSNTHYGDSSNIGRQAPENGPGGTSARQQVSELAGGLKQQASDVTQDVSRQIKEQASRLGESAKEAAAGAGEKLRTAAEGQKNAGADFVSGIAGAVRRAAGEFDDQIPQASTYIRRAADGIDGASDALRERNLSELFENVQQFARRQPTAFLGITVLAGFAAVRFLKSSPSSRPSGGSVSDHATSQHFSSRVAGSENARRLAGAGGGMMPERGM